MLTFQPKDPGESIALIYSMVNGLATGETLTTINSVNVATLHGVDPSPTGILNGNAGLDSTSTQVIVPVTAGVNGCTYEITVTVATSNAKKVLVLSAALPVSVAV